MTRSLFTHHTHFVLVNDCAHLQNKKIISNEVTVRCTWVTPDEVLNYLLNT